jgi:hypothetical protein
VVAVAVAALVAVGLGLPAGSPASADVVAPSTRTFGALIDNPASWERESGCSPTEKKGPKQLRKLLLATYGPVGANIVRACSRADSGHEEGRALDWMVSVRDPAQKAIAESYLAWLQAPDEFGNPSAMARRLGISYVIWNNQMWRPGSGLWSAYSDCAEKKKRFKKFDNTCHRNHVHTSFSWDGALGRTSYYTGFVACPAPVVNPWPPLLVPAAPAVVPVAPARLVGSRKGIGLAAGPCRVHPDVRLDVPVLGVGGVPATGVAAVTLRVYVIKPDLPAELRVWTAGTAVPLTPRSAGVPGQQTVTDVTVPVGPEGLVSLQLAGGMGHLAVDVTGYSVGAAF